MHTFLQKLQKYISPIILLVVIISALFLFSQEILSKKQARIIFLDVGQGDAILIISPNGRQVLVDSGKYDDISMKITKYMPFSDRSLDFVIVTHPDIDHIAGFNALLDEYEIGTFIHSGLLAGAPVYRSIAKKVQKYHIPQHQAVAGEKIFLDKDMYLEILSPYTGQKVEDANSASVVVHLLYRGHDVLLTGDAPQKIEQNLLSLYGKRLKSDILKMGHHGSKNSSGRKFVESVNPQYGIISAGCHNRYGHPSARVLRLLDDLKITELSTCETGDIIFDFVDNGWVLKK